MADVFADGWTLHFYDFQQQFVSVDDVISGIADVETWAKRNGARDGTPFFLDPWGRADALVNAYWRDPLVRGRATGTLRRYALSLKVWLDFLHAIGVRRWDGASRSDLAAFKEWRLSSEENPQHVSANSFCVDRAAIRNFYSWAAEQHGVENPVRAVRLLRLGWAGAKSCWRAPRRGCAGPT